MRSLALALALLASACSAPPCPEHSYLLQLADAGLECHFDVCWRPDADGGAYLPDPPGTALRCPAVPVPLPR